MNRTIRAVFTIILAAAFSVTVAKAAVSKVCEGNPGITSVDLFQGGNDEVNNVVFYPNPVKDFMTVRFPRKGNFTVTIYNIIGDKVMTRNIMDDNEMHLDVSGLQNGLYFISYEYDGKVLTKRFSKIL